MTLKYYRYGRISMIEMPVSWSPAMIAWLMGEAPLHRGSKLPWTFNTPLIGKMHFHPDTTICNSLGSRTLDFRALR